MQAGEEGAPRAAHTDDLTSEPDRRLDNQSQLFHREVVNEDKSPDKKEQSCTKELQCVFYSLVAVLAVMLTLVLVFLAISGQLNGFPLQSAATDTETETAATAAGTEVDSYDTQLPSDSDYFNELNHNYNVSEGLDEEENELPVEDIHAYNSTHNIQYYYIDLNSTDIDFDLVNQTEFLEQLKQNETGIEGIERLEDLNAEALIGGSPQSRGYVAYIPVPINNDGGDEDDNDDDEEDEEEDHNPKRKPAAARSRTRPVKVPYLVPIMMMPSSAIHGHNPQQSSLNNARLFPGSRNFLTSMGPSGSYPSSHFGNVHGGGALNPLASYGAFYGNTNADNVRQASSPMNNVLLSSGTLGSQPNPMVVHNFQDAMQNSNYAPVVALPTGGTHQPSMGTYSQLTRPAYNPTMPSQTARNSAIDYRMFGTLASDQSAVPRTHRESFPNSNSRDFNQPAAPGRRLFNRYSTRNGWSQWPSGGDDESYFQNNRPAYRPLVNRPYDNRRPISRSDYRMDNLNYRGRPPTTPPLSNNYPRSPMNDPRWGPQSRYSSSSSSSAGANPMSIQDIISYMTALGTEENSNAKFSNTQYSSSNNYDSRNRGSYTSYHQPSSNYRNNYQKPKEPIAMMMDIYPAPAAADSHQYRPPHDTHGYRQHTSNSYQYSRYPGHRDRERERDRDRDRVHNYDTHGRDAYEHQRNSDQHEADYASPVYVSSKSPSTHHSRPYAHVSKDDDEPKHQVVLHLNLYPRRPNTTGNKHRVGIDRDTHQDSEDGHLLSSADIYREAMRNAAAKRDGFPGESEEDYGASTTVLTHKEGPRDDGLPGGESKVLVSHKITTDHGIDSIKNHRIKDDSYENYKNHRMSDRLQTNPSHTRASHYPESRFDDDDYEPLPLPLPQNVEDNSTTAAFQQDPSSTLTPTTDPETTTEENVKQDTKPSVFAQLFG